jgi:hypothetical protein
VPDPDEREARGGENFSVGRGHPPGGTSDRYFEGSARASSKLPPFGTQHWIEVRSGLPRSRSIGHLDEARLAFWFGLADSGSASDPEPAGLSDRLARSCDDAGVQGAPCDRGRCRRSQRLREHAWCARYLHAETGVTQQVFEEELAVLPPTKSDLAHFASMLTKPCNAGRNLVAEHDGRVVGALTYGRASETVPGGHRRVCRRGL